MAKAYENDPNWPFFHKDGRRASLKDVLNVIGEDWRDATIEKIAALFRAAGCSVS